MDEVTLHLCRNGPWHPHPSNLSFQTRLLSKYTAVISCILSSWKLPVEDQIPSCFKGTKEKHIPVLYISHIHVLCIVVDDCISSCRWLTESMWHHASFDSTSLLSSRNMPKITNLSDSQKICSLFHHQVVSESNTYIGVMPFFHMFPLNACCISSITSITLSINMSFRRTLPRTPQEARHKRDHHAACR